MYYISEEGKKKRERRTHTDDKPFYLTSLLALRNEIPLVSVGGLGQRGSHHFKRENEITQPVLREDRREGGGLNFKKKKSEQPGIG